jgi:hypothetical protein
MRRWWEFMFEIHQFWGIHHSSSVTSSSLGFHLFVFGWKQTHILLKIKTDGLLSTSLSWGIPFTHSTLCVLNRFQDEDRRQRNVCTWEFQWGTRLIVRSGHVASWSPKSVDDEERQLSCPRSRTVVHFPLLQNTTRECSDTITIH